MSEQWLMRVEGGFAAHFNVPNGPSRPGVHLAIGLKHGEETYKVFVKGWHPSQGMEHTIYIGNPRHT